MSVLIVDAEESARRSLGALLVHAGFDVEVAASDGEAAGLLKGRRFELVLAGWGPGLAGFETLTALRARDAATPVILLCARDSVDARLKAFGAGADDFLARPFNNDELVARMRAVLRRASLHTSHLLQVADLTLDVSNHSAVRSGKPIRLTRREFELLRYLMEHRGEALSREQLLERVWSSEYEIASNVVEVYIRLHRRKVDGPFLKSLIRTVRGVGYMVGEGSAREDATRRHHSRTRKGLKFVVQS
jgi:DNA-binding response OmpR family regulator